MAMTTTYRYGGDDERYYPTFGMTAKPGETYDFAGDPPDDRFKPVSARSAKPQE